MMENSDNATTYAEKLEAALKFHEVGTMLYQFDPLWNRLQLSVTKDDCPTPGCPMVLPHLHSMILEGPQCPGCSGCEETGLCRA